MLITFSIILVICLHNDGEGGVVGGGVTSGTPSSCTEQDGVGEIMQMLSGFLGLDFCSILEFMTAIKCSCGWDAILGYEKKKTKNL